MSMADLALQALLTEQARQNAMPTWSERFAALVPSAFKTIADASSIMKKDAAEYGTPQRGSAPVITIGAPPPDPRRRILGIPMGGAPPAATMIQPPMAGDMATDLSTLPPELLTGDVTSAISQGQQVYYRPASANYRPATLGKDEKTLRSGMLTHITPAGGDYSNFMAEPSTPKALKGATPRISGSFGGGMVDYTDDLRAQMMAVNGGVDPFPGVKQIPYSSVNRLLGENALRTRPTTLLSAERLKQMLSSTDEETIRGDIATLKSILQADEMGQYMLEPAKKAELTDVYDKLTTKFAKSRGGGGPAKSTTAVKYESAEDVRAAYQAGKITREQAKKELTKFGIK